MAEEKAREKSKWRRLRTALLTALATLLLAEIVLYFVLGNLDIAPLMRDPGDGRCVGLEPGGEATYTGTGLRIPAVSHSANRYGYRGAAREREPRSDGTRVVALGDSYTFGLGVSADEALPAALEAALLEAEAAPVEVLNFGIPGLNLEEVTEQYRHFARDWHPDVVVYFLFENDLDLGLCDLADRTTFMWLLRHSRLFRLGVVALAPDALGAPDPTSTPERVSRLRRGLVELRDVVSRDGGRLVVVSLADPLDDADATRSVLAQIEIPALVFEREFYERLEQIPHEGHWTAAATRSAAGTIADWLLRENVLAAP
ncbi:MAG: SGNH/GDSL hydrolase family protein [Sandaracinaceae bacterium]